MNDAGKTRATLRRRMIIQLGLMVTCSLMIGVGAIVCIDSLHQDHDVSVQGYRQLRQVYEIGFQAAIAKEALSATQAGSAKALTAMEAADLKLGPAYYDASGELPARWLNETRRAECREPILEAIVLLQRPDASSQDARLREMSLVNDLLGRLAMLSAEIRTTIADIEQRADNQRRMVVPLVVGLSMIVVVIAVITGTRQYRSVVNPLDQLAQSVRRFAQGKLSERIPLAGDREFAALANDFNNMADQLESFCRDLERKVEIKSKELVRSERLASVGYLAAGVAHEINNPLSIITGYGERTLRLLDRGMDESAVRNTRNTIRIICEEAFRCKDITDRLLSLARPGTDDRRPVSLRTIAADVIKNISGLPEYATRQVLLKTASDENLDVIAKEGEIRQVIINLLLNALEAVQPAVGFVQVRIDRLDDEVELTICDNGRGMTPETLDRILEPFFTDKRGERPGIGLGLSITHAIVVNHGGRLWAESAGLGLGSRFVARFPAATVGVEHARH